MADRLLAEAGIPNRAPREKIGYLHSFSSFFTQAPVQRGDGIAETISRMAAAIVTQEAQLLEQREAASDELLASRFDPSGQFARRYCPPRRNIVRRTTCFRSSVWSVLMVIESAPAPCNTA